MRPRRDRGDTVRNCCGYWNGNRASVMGVRGRWPGGWNSYVPWSCASGVARGRLMDLVRSSGFIGLRHRSRHTLNPGTCPFFASKSKGCWINARHQHAILRVVQHRRHSSIQDQNGDGKNINPQTCLLAAPPASACSWRRAWSRARITGIRRYWHSLGIRNGCGFRPASDEACSKPHRRNP